jgi:hypothetical protein
MNKQDELVERLIKVDGHDIMMHILIDWVIKSQLTEEELGLGLNNQKITPEKKRDLIRLLQLRRRSYRDGDHLRICNQLITGLQAGIIGGTSEPSPQ